MGIAALILGIVGLILAWIPLIGILGVVLAIIALILGIIGAKKGQKGLGIAGIILGAVAIVLGLWVQIPTIMFTQAVSEEGIQALEEGLNDPALQQQLERALEETQKQEPQQ